MYIQTIASIAMLSGLAFGFMSIINNSVSSLSSSEAKTNLFNHRSQIESVMRSEEAWIQTLKHISNGGNFDCFLNPLRTCPKNMVFNLIDASGNPVHAGSANPRFGFNSIGVSCTAFDPINGNNSCPFGLQFRWERFCASPCIEPIARLTADFSYRQEYNQYPFNINRLDLAVLRTSSDMNPSSVIEANSIDWTDLGFLIMIDGSPVQFREYTFPLSVPKSSVFSLSVYNLVSWGPAVLPVPSTIRSIATVYIDGVRCARARSSTDISGQTTSSSTACMRNLSAGTYQIRVTGSGWGDLVATPDFRQGHIGYQLLAR